LGPLFATALFRLIGGEASKVADVAKEVDIRKDTKIPDLVRVPIPSNSTDLKPENI
jgi:hypothetical protein